MPKSKSSTALFDVLNQGESTPEQKLQVPGWWLKHPDPEDRETEDWEPPAAGVDSTISPSSEKDEPDIERLPTTVEDEPVSDSGSFMVMDGERIRVSFTSFTGAIVVFAVLVLILATYELGRVRGNRGGFSLGYEAGRTSFEARTLSEIENARSRPPATHAVQSLMTSTNRNDERSTMTASLTGALGAVVQWVRDYTYIVAQEFGRDYAEHSDRAQSFLADNGVETVQIRLPNGSVQLITVKGYNRKDATQKIMADQLLEKIHEIGMRYFASGGGYRLRGYFKTLKSNSWTGSTD